MAKCYPRYWRVRTVRHFGDGVHLTNDIVIQTQDHWDAEKRAMNLGPLMSSSPRPTGMAVVGTVEVTTR